MVEVTSHLITDHVLTLEEEAEVQGGGWEDLEELQVAKSVDAKVNSSCSFLNRRLYKMNMLHSYEYLYIIFSVQCKTFKLVGNFNNTCLLLFAGPAAPPMAGGG